MVIVDHFWSFFPDGDFFQKIWLSHTTICGPQHQAKFQKKLMSQFQEKLRTDPISYDPSGWGWGPSQTPTDKKIFTIYVWLCRLFREETSACVAVQTCYVVDACDHVWSIILLASFVLVTLTRLIVSEPKTE